MISPSFTNVASADDLSADIAAIDRDSQSGSGTGTAYSITLAPGATLTESANLAAINLNGADTLTIDGGPTGATLDGDNAYRGFFVYQGKVTFANLTIQNAVATGGAGGPGGGGGGAGLGGGLFVAADSANDAFPSDVTLENVTFTNDRAVGGAGGAGGDGSGGGGGLGGDGGGGTSVNGIIGSGGGGGIGGGQRVALGGPPGLNGYDGIVVGAAGGGSATGGAQGGTAGGGGGGNAGVTATTGGGGGGGGGIDGASSTSSAGGDGGFGGGGGGANSNGGDGGFGGGGGFSTDANGGVGGFGGGGGGSGRGAGGSAGFGGGDGTETNGSNNLGSGGGGLGAGGGVFVQQGAFLTVVGGNLSGGSATGGTSPGLSGQGIGTGIFLPGNMTFGTGSTAGQITEVDDVISDGIEQNHGSGIGVGSVTIEGAGTVRFKGANDYLGDTTIKSGTLDLEAIGGQNGAGHGSIVFAGPNATLQLGPVAFANSQNEFGNYVDGFAAGDTIDLRGFKYIAGQTSASFYQGNGGRNFLEITNGTTTDYIFYGGSADQTFVTKDDGERGTDVMLMCFVSGTSISTTRGDVAVEDLLVGDLVVTAAGGVRPIRWLGRRTVDCRSHPRPTNTYPVRIAAHAFGLDLPARDLYLSPGHPVLVGADDTGSVLVPIICLVNGTTIARMPVDHVTYWHVELDGHDILLAEGLPAESYIDLGSRAWFAGADGVLYDPDMAAPGMPGRCRPVAVDGPVVEAERRRLDQAFATRLASAAQWPDVRNALLALF